MIRVKVYSTLPLERAGLGRLLEGEPDTVVLPPEGDPPDVAVLTGDAGWRAVLARLMESRSPPAFLLVSDEAPECRHLAASAPSAWGVLPPGVTPAELRAAVRAASEGLVVIHPSLVTHLAGGGGGVEDNDSVEDLTDREREVLDLLSKGFTNPEIAGLLKISEHTVKFHTSSLYTKLGVANRTEAVRAGIRTGAIHL